MKRPASRFAELAGFMNVFPQEIRSFGVARKTPFAELSRLPAEIDACREALGESGRTIVRYSGTENKIRILVEAEPRATMSGSGSSGCRPQPARS